MWRRAALADTIERLQSDRELGPNFAAWHRIPPVPPDIAPFPPSLEPRLTEALSRRGIERLYTHQAEAVGAASAAGRNRLFSDTAPAPSGPGPTGSDEAPRVRIPHAPPVFVFEKPSTGGYEPSSIMRLQRPKACAEVRGRSIYGFRYHGPI